MWAATHTAQMNAPTLLVSQRTILERVMGIEPTLTARTAEVLPLNYICVVMLLLKPFKQVYIVYYQSHWWRGKDSNLRRLSRQIYSLLPLAAREPLLDMQAANFARTAPACPRSTGSKIAERGEIRRCNPGARGRETPAARPRPR